MTTIAFDGTTMACDTCVTGNFKYYTHTKIYENDRFVMGVSGDAGVGRLLVVDAEILTPKYYDFDFSALVFVKEDNRIFRVEFFKSWDSPLSSVIPIAGNAAAVGSGAPYALTAMFLGTTATEAVEVAKRFDPGTDGSVITHRLG
ncbi:peptidase HslV family protein [Salmonella phage ZCSE9]|uniref:Peptidase HslV family protein n=1 Tax=Salmonella phage ZCSE9 TaxID=2996091 RepID=A0A9E8K306_9CAUD|nr:peptidase HslV family protein [Salmonella phage ZCSE9]EEF1427335.1 hypothetical protein [Salmonella enterica subsp. enterica serovar Enteritidis]UZV41026.1 peptidase HslV family protein [Salmonella phage ZCSE9]